MTFGQFTIGQSLQVLKPTLGPAHIYSKPEQLVWQKALDQLSKINSGDLNYESLSETDKHMIDSLEMNDGPMTQGAGCSWYCGGGPYKVTSSSYLKEQDNASYKPDNLHDFDLFTAWVPNTKDGIIGNKVNFHFKPYSPRVNKIIIYNGYIKNKELWIANSRAKKLKLYINNKPEAILELKDVTSSQSFNIAPIQSRDSTKDLILTLEILEIFKGTRYEDLAISEINFNGIDVHCFAAGTKVLMANRTEKDIKSIKPGDSVCTFNFDTYQIKTTQVSQLITTLHSNLLKLIFSDREIIVTDDHPFYLGDKKWASINPNRSNNLYFQENIIANLKVGDRVFIPAEHRYIELKNVIQVNNEQLTYTIELSSGDSFITNGLLVKTEKAKETFSIADRKN